MKIQAYILLILFLYFFHFHLSAQNQQLYDIEGNLKAYITPEQELYSTETSQMIAYLFWNQETDEYWVYNLDGWHLGYFQQGVLFNTNYQGVLVSEDAISQKISQITYKGIKSILYNLEIHSWISLEEFLSN